MNDPPQHNQVVIIGTGLAGLSAAVYAARGNNDPLVFEGDEPGGQLTLTAEVENYPGFPDGVGGAELIGKMKTQAERFGAEIKNGVVERVDDDGPPFTITLTNGDIYTADSIIAASGASARTLGVPGEDELMGYGVSTCATCDGAFFRGEDMLVVGGGDAAAEEAIFLTKFADTVYVAHRRDELRSEGILKDQLLEKARSNEVEMLWNTEVTEISGSQSEGVDSVRLVHNPTGHPTSKLDSDETTEKLMDVGAVFYAIGHTPNTEYLAETDVVLDDIGYIETQGGDGGQQTVTDVDGIYAAGDVVDSHYQQAVTAAGMGCQAALDVDEYLEQLSQ